MVVYYMAVSIKSPSELRRDPVSQGWIVIATGRARRPDSFQKEQRTQWKVSRDDCPFETLEQEHPTLVFFKGNTVELAPFEGTPKSWTTISIPNRFPAFSKGKELQEKKIGPYHIMQGIGFHEVVITKDHEKDIAEFPIAGAKELIDVYQERYLDLMNEPLVHYVAIFKNRGPQAGASVYHPHSQIIALPVTDPDIEQSLRGSLQYWKEHKSCVHCVMMHWDKKQKQRIVFENECYIVLCPFASSVAFEVRIYPKIHLAYFERVDDYEKQCLAEAFVKTFQKLKRALNDPDYNYFLHTAPADGKNYDYYHWHFEILPKTGVWGGFELGTGVKISTIEPEKAAEFLQAQ